MFLALGQRRLVEGLSNGESSHCDGALYRFACSESIAFDHGSQMLRYYRLAASVRSAVPKQHPANFNDGTPRARDLSRSFHPCLSATAYIDDTPPAPESQYFRTLVAFQFFGSI
jgi:hypothetical protein